MSNTLYNKCKTCDFKQVLESKGYVYFAKGYYNLNIIGVRSNQNNKVTNKFDDYLVLDYNTEQGHKRKVYNITTEPGFLSIRKPSNVKGTAILVPNQYLGVYKLDLHKGKYKALCQRNGSVQVYRDNNKNVIYDLDPKTIEKGNFGINIHRANEWYTKETIDGYSAGCQVFNKPAEFKEFLKLCEKSASIYGNKFTYTLINEEDLG